MNRNVLQTTKQGQSLPIIALIILVVVAMVGLAVDVNNTYAQQRLVVRAANASSIAGMNELLYNADATNGSIRNSVISTLEANDIQLVDPSQRGDPPAGYRSLYLYYLTEDGSLYEGCGETYDCSEDTAIPRDEVTSIQVKLGGRVDTFFASVVGRETLPVSSDGVAIQEPCVDGVYPIGISEAVIADLEEGDFVEEEGVISWDGEDARIPGISSDIVDLTEQHETKLLLKDADFTLLRWTPDSNMGDMMQAGGNLGDGFEEGGFSGKDEDTIYRPGRLDDGDVIETHPEMSAEQMENFAAAFRSHIENRTLMSLPIMDDDTMVALGWFIPLEIEQVDISETETPNMVWQVKMVLLRDTPNCTQVVASNPKSTPIVRTPTEEDTPETPTNTEIPPLTETETTTTETETTTTETETTTTETETTTTETETTTTETETSTTETETSTTETETSTTETETSTTETETSTTETETSTTETETGTPTETETPTLPPPEDTETPTETSTPSPTPTDQPPETVKTVNVTFAPCEEDIDPATGASGTVTLSRAGENDITFNVNIGRGETAVLETTANPGSYDVSVELEAIGSDYTYSATSNVFLASGNTSDVVAEPNEPCELPATETPTSTATSTSTPTETNTPTETSTSTSTPTETPTNTSTPTETPTNTSTPTATETPTPETIAVSFQACVGEDCVQPKPIQYVVVMDVSGSMFYMDVDGNGSYSNYHPVLEERRAAVMKESLVKFVDEYMQDDDRMQLVWYNTGVDSTSGMSSDKEDLKQAILEAGSEEQNQSQDYWYAKADNYGGFTNSARALLKANDLVEGYANNSSYKTVVVFATDGAANYRLVPGTSNNWTNNTNTAWPTNNNRKCAANDAQCNKAHPNAEDGVVMEEGDIFDAASPVMQMIEAGKMVNNQGVEVYSLAFGSDDASDLGLTSMSTTWNAHSEQELDNVLGTIAKRAAGGCEVLEATYEDATPENTSGTVTLVDADDNETTIDLEIADDGSLFFSTDDVEAGEYQVSAVLEHTGSDDWTRNYKQIRLNGSGEFAQSATMTIGDGSTTSIELGNELCLVEEEEEEDSDNTCPCEGDADGEESGTLNNDGECVCEVDEQPGDDTGVCTDWTEAPAEGAVRIATDDASYDVIFEGAENNGDGTSTWTYTVDEISGKDLSHWTLALPSCVAVDTEMLRYPSSVEGQPELGTDPTTGVSGIKWNFTDSFSSGEFEVVINASGCEGGSVEPGNTAAAVKTGGRTSKTAEGVVTGPVVCGEGSDVEDPGTTEPVTQPDPATNEVNYVCEGQFVDLEGVGMKYGNDEHKDLSKQQLTVPGDALWSVIQLGGRAIGTGKYPSDMNPSLKFLEDGEERDYDLAREGAPGFSWYGYTYEISGNSGSTYKMKMDGKLIQGDPKSGGSTEGLVMYYGMPNNNLMTGVGRTALFGAWGGYSDPLRRAHIELALPEPIVDTADVNVKMAVLEHDKDDPRQIRVRAFATAGAPDIANNGTVSNIVADTGYKTIEEPDLDTYQLNIINNDAGDEVRLVIEDVPSTATHVVAELYSPEDYCSNCPGANKLGDSVYLIGAVAQYDCQTPPTDE
jgi:ferredoxin-thioredoxin reductase catalytic subunit